MELQLNNQYSMSSFSQVSIPFSKKIVQMALSNHQNNPMLAVLHQDIIVFYDSQGQLVEGKDICRKIQATVFEWHPVQKVLALGWASGAVSLYSEENNSIRDEQDVHRASIMLLKYNPTGSRMVTADKDGLVCIWRGLTCLSSYQRPGLIQHCCFAELNLDAKQVLGNLFFFGGSQGVVALADDSSHISEICKIAGSIAAIQFYSKQNSVIIISSSLLFVQFRISAHESISAPEKKVKLSIAGDPEHLISLWVGDCLLCTSSNENMIRLWHLDDDENYVLTLFDQEVQNDKIKKIKYESKGRLMVGGTQEGRLVFWKNGSEQFEESEHWRVVASPVKGSTPVKDLAIGHGIIAAQYEHEIVIVQETQISAKVADKLSVIQLSCHKLRVTAVQDKKVLTYDFDTNYLIKGYDLQGKKLLTWNGKNIEIYEILVDRGEISLPLFGTIVSDCRKAQFLDQLLVIYHPGQMTLMNHQGNVKQQVPFPESEGYISDLSVVNQVVLTHTAKHMIKVFDCSRREAKQVGVTRKFVDSQGKALGEITLCQINKSGNRVLILTKDKKCYLYDLDVDTMNFVTSHSLKAVWDKNDERFFAIQKQAVKGAQTIETFFYSSENGPKKLDHYKCHMVEQELFALSVPYMYYIHNNDNKYEVIEEKMKDFQGLENIDDIIVNAILNFNFNLCIGNLDEAYKSIKSVQNPLIWENMAQMCVKTGRLDVAEICIGNMRFARGAKAVREAKKEPEQEAKLAMVAIQLNMLPEAKELYETCGRFDLLNKMNQASGNWQEAVEVAQNHDRINLKNTYFNTARLLETQRDFKKAIEYYELAECAHAQIPRMFMQANLLDELFDYISQKEDKSLYGWWAQYQESVGNYEEANKYYKMAEDFGSLVRIMINSNDLENAKKFCMTSNDAQASYILAKQLEIQGLHQEAISFYAKAQHYSHAVRLARELQIDSEVMSLSLMSQPRCMNQSAEYFEVKGLNEKAIILYMKAKNIKKAINLAVKSKLYDYIQKITYNIGEEEDVEVLAQVAEYFINNNQYDKAIHLLVASKQVERALEIFVENNIPITDDIAAKLLPKEIDEKDPKSLDTVKKVADKAKKQGNFDLAARLYRQLRDNVKAMKCMCKLNDTEKVISFAQNARNPEIYIIAGNYLQSADWHNNQDILKNIVSFYTRAKAFDRLAMFYETCAGLEIDEYKDYKKAIMALKDAVKYWQKSNNEDKGQSVSQKIFLIEKYLQAMDLEQSDPQEMVKICQQLAENPVCEQAIRSGDLYAPIIEYFYASGNQQGAYGYLKKLQDKQVPLHLYLNKEIIMNLNATFGAKTQPSVSQHQDNLQNQEDDNMIEEEEINEDIM